MAVAPSASQTILRQTGPLAFARYGPLCDAGPLGFRFGRAHAFVLKRRIYHSLIKAALGEPVAPPGNQTNDHSVHYIYICCTWEKKLQLGSTARGRGGGQYLSQQFSPFLMKQSLPSVPGTCRFSICKPFPRQPRGFTHLFPLRVKKNNKNCIGYALSQVFLGEDMLPNHLMFMILCSWSENMQVILLANAKYGTTKSSKIIHLLLATYLARL